MAPTRAEQALSPAPARSLTGHLALAARVLDDLDCAVCGRDVPHELVECLDGHGEDCPDRVCTDCGSVLVVGSAPLLQRSA
ncbi:hypothetical protein [Pseudokineococcus sp. 1T1Z-3]|uniref:hypothetical protein n=1 Tax=Pseudokineococcus sp. 1T1Z-3 TaxID=3132745 RepID=UPI0030AFE68D